MVLSKINDFFWYRIKNLIKYEKKLIKYQGYGDRSILEFKRRNDLKWSTIEKILKELIIVDGLELRNCIRKLYENNKDLIENPNTFISHFGPVGKSGALILNQFLRCYPGKSWKIIPATKLQELGEDSSVIFLDDFIGTGQQAITYIKEIGYTLNSSTKPYLFTICATEMGIKKIERNNSNFKIESSIILNEKEFSLLDDQSQILSNDEKIKIKKLNAKLGILDNSNFHLGLPFAFYYSAPDNALGILWNDNTKYIDDKKNDKKWYALIPREY